MTDVLIPVPVEFAVQVVGYVEGLKNPPTPEEPNAFWEHRLRMIAVSDVPGYQRLGRIMDFMSLMPGVRWNGDDIANFLDDGTTPEQIRRMWSPLSRSFQARFGDTELPLVKDWVVNRNYYSMTAEMSSLWQTIRADS